MQTPRPDLFTYPPHGDSTGGIPAGGTRRNDIGLKRPWMRAAFLGGLIGFAALGFALSLT